MLPPVMAPVAPMAADKKNQEGRAQGSARRRRRPVRDPARAAARAPARAPALAKATARASAPAKAAAPAADRIVPGSGVEPPRLLREVRADYTDEARRANINGEVVLEIVVRRDGTVGDVRILQRLGVGP